MKNFLGLILLLPLVALSDESLYPIEISYGSYEKQRIDFYKGSSDKVLIWIHGGGWLFGDKRSERWIKRFHNHFIEHEDLNVYMIGYRTGEETAPKAVDDVICAYKKIVDDASFQEHKNDVRAEKTTDTKTDAASISSQHSFPLTLPSPYMSVSDGLHSFSSMTSVPEEICMTHSSFLGSYRSPSSQNEDLSDFSNKQTVRECCRRRELNICGGQSNHEAGLRDRD